MNWILRITIGLALSLSSTACKHAAQSSETKDVIGDYTYIAANPRRVNASVVFSDGLYLCYTKVARSQQVNVRSPFVIYASRNRSCSDGEAVNLSLSFVGQHLSDMLLYVTPEGFTRRIGYATLTGNADIDICSTNQNAHLLGSVSCDVTVDAAGKVVIIDRHAQ